MDLGFWDVCIYNFKIRSGLIRKRLLIMLKATPVLLGKSRKVQMDHVANLVKCPYQCSVAYLQATGLKVETDCPFKKGGGGEKRHLWKLTLHNMA